MTDTLKKFAVIGDPVAHSRSPVIHNAAFKELGIAAEYEKVLVPKGDAKSFMTRIRAKEYWGCNVTIPHKQDVLSLVDYRTDFAAKVGAVNTVYWHDNKVWGDNTDGPGFINALHDANFNPQDKHVFLFGAGGATRGVAYALCDASVQSLTICNRDASRADKLCEELAQVYANIQIQRADWLKFHDLPTPIELMVNCTSLGLADNPWPDLSFLDRLATHTVVSDIVYPPEKTEFLKHAEQNGCSIISGKGMFIGQAALSFERFVGQKPSIKTMTKALESS